MPRASQPNNRCRMTASRFLACRVLRQETVILHRLGVLLLLAHRLGLLLEPIAHPGWSRLAQDKPERGGPAIVGILKSDGLVEQPRALARGQFRRAGGERPGQEPR